MDPKSKNTAVAGAGVGGAMATLMVMFAPLADWMGKPPDIPLSELEVALAVTAFSTIFSWAFRFMPKPKG